MSARCAHGEGQCSDRQGAAARRGWGHGWLMRCWGWGSADQGAKALAGFAPSHPSFTPAAADEVLSWCPTCPGSPRSTPLCPELPVFSLSGPGPCSQPTAQPQARRGAARCQRFPLGAGAAAWGISSCPPWHRAGRAPLPVAQSSVPRPTPLGWRGGSCLQQPQQREARPPFPRLLPRPAPLQVCLPCLQAQSISTHWAIGEVNSSSALGLSAAEPRGQPWG